MGLSSCSNEDVVKDINDGGKFSRVSMDLSASDNIESVKCVFFRDGNLSYVGSCLLYTSPSPRDCS